MTSSSRLEFKVDQQAKYKPKKLRHELLQQFKGQNETKVPTPDQALRRAAIFGTTEDIDALLYYGANINSQDEKNQYTALHHTVINKKVNMARHLLSRNASRHIKDSSDNTQVFYVKNAKTPELTNLFRDSSPVALQSTDMLANNTSFLSREELRTTELISHNWKNATEKTIKDHFTKNKMVLEYAHFKKLPKYLQYIISKSLIDNKQIKIVNKLFEMLKLSFADRLIQIYPKDYQTRTNHDNQNLLSDTGITLVVLGYLPAELYQYQNSLCTEYGVLMFAFDLLTSEQIKIFQKRDTHSAQLQEALKSLICKNGFLAMREKLITLEDAYNFNYNRRSDLGILLSDFGLKSLRDKLITSKQAICFSDDSLKNVLTNDGAKIIEEKLFSFRKYVEKDSHILRNISLKFFLLLNGNGLIALRDKLITQDHIEMHQLSSPNLSHLVSSNGLKILREGLLMIDEIIKITNITMIVSNNGILALRKGYFSPEQLSLIQTDSLSSIFSDEGMRFIEEKLISFEEYKQNDAHKILEVSNKFRPLLNDFGFIALKQNLLTQQHLEMKELTLDKLRHLLTKNGVQILKEQLLSMKILIKISSLEPLVSNEYALQALREKLITEHHLAIEELTTSKLKCLFTKNGIIILKEGLLTIEQVIQISDLETMLSDNGLKALRKKYLMPDRIFRIKDLRTLLSDNGLEALSLGLVTHEDAIKDKRLLLLKMPNGLKALKEKLITFEQAESFYKYGEPFMCNSFSVLLSDIGIQALREKLITPEQAAQFYHGGTGCHYDCLEELLSPTGMEALRQRLIKPEDGYNQVDLGKALPKNKLNINILKALRYKLFTLDEIRSGKKYSTWGANAAGYTNLDTYMIKVVETHEKYLNKTKYNTESKEIQADILTAQKIFRGAIARKKLSLFKELQTCMRTASIHDAEAIVQTKQLIEKCKIKDASIQIKKLKRL